MRSKEWEAKLASKEHDELVGLMKQQINATDRATHAVRAIVLPSTITLIALLIALPIMLLGVFTGEGGGVATLFIGGLVLLGGGIMAIAAQISETRLSDVPGRYVTASTPAIPPSAAGEAGGEPSSDYMVSDTETRKCTSCGAVFPKTRMVCPECGMN